MAKYKYVNYQRVAMNVLLTSFAIWGIVNHASINKFHNFQIELK